MTSPDEPENARARERAGIAAAIVAPLPLIGWAAWRTATGGWRWEYLLFLALAPALAWTSAPARRLFWGLFPFAILAFVYDAMRFVSRSGIDPRAVHDCDLRALDARWFGVGGRTVHDWLQAHSSPVLDVVCAIPYGTFIAVTLAFAIYLFAKDRAAMRRFGWAVLLVNVCGFVTYRLYPAAPPWYFHAHGCVVDLATRTNEGPNLARVDAWTGLGFFRGLYGRSSNVFGAVPSLHVTYPLLVLLFGWPLFRAPGRAAAGLFFGTMCFAAVYLDHHWVLDVLLGVGYALVVHRLVLALGRMRARAPSDAASKAASRALRVPANASAKTRAAYALATWFGCGYAPFAPGTAGTLGALPLYFLVRPLGAAGVLTAAILLTAAGVWAAAVVCAESGREDPQIVVIDEVAGVLFVLAATPPTVLATAAAVLAFRVFDQLKPWPAYVAERALPGGWGVMLDDVVAGAWGAGAITLLANMGAL